MQADGQGTSLSGRKYNALFLRYARNGMLQVFDTDSVQPSQIDLTPSGTTPHEVTILGSKRRRAIPFVNQKSSNVAPTTLSPDAAPHTLQLTAESASPKSVNLYRMCGFPIKKRRLDNRMELSRIQLPSASSDTNSCNSFVQQPTGVELESLPRFYVGPSSDTRAVLKMGDNCEDGGKALFCRFCANKLWACPADVHPEGNASDLQPN